MDQTFLLKIFGSALSLRGAEIRIALFCHNDVTQSNLKCENL